MKGSKYSIPSKLPIRHKNAEYPIRDRDYLLDKNGLLFKVIGDVHPKSHYLGYVKYYPHVYGDRRIFGINYRQNTLVSNSIGILYDNPDYFVYSNMLGSVITGVPRGNLVTHYSCRGGLRNIHSNSELTASLDCASELKEIIEYIFSRDEQELFGITGSLLVNCFNQNSDIDLICYGEKGLEAAKNLFKNSGLIKPYQGNALNRLYNRRAKYLHGGSFDQLIKQEKRKLQGLTLYTDTHINCEPIRTDDTDTFQQFSEVKELGGMEIIVRIIEHSEGQFTPSIYNIETVSVLDLDIGDSDTIAFKIEYLISYLGAYTGVFRAGDLVHVQGKAIHFQHNLKSTFGLELTPWTQGESYSANLLN